MSRLTVFVTTILIMLCVVPLHALADEVNEARKDIESAYSKIDASLLQRDYQSVLRFYDPDFTETNKNGKKTTFKDAATALKSYKIHNYKYFKYLEQKTTISKFELNDDQATVNTEMKNVFYSFNPVTSEKLLGVYNSTYVDVWRKKNGMWRILSKRMITSKGVINGKQVY